MIFKATDKQIELTLNDILFGHETENTKDKTIKTIIHVIMITKMPISKFKYRNQIYIYIYIYIVENITKGVHNVCSIILEREVRLRLED